jgi:hypothetical protein
MKTTRKSARKVGPSDAKLLKLEAKRSKLLAEAKVLSNEEERRCKLIKARFGSTSWPKFDGSNPLFSGTCFELPLDGRIARWQVVNLNRHIEELADRWKSIPAADPARKELKAEWERRRREGRARVEWWKREHAKITRARKAARVGELDAKWSRLIDRANAIEDQITHVPASGLAGVGVKLRVFCALALELEVGRDCGEDDLDQHFQPAFSARRDVERLLKSA